MQLSPFNMRWTFGLWSLLASVAMSQVILPSNNSADLSDPASSPRFIITPTSGGVQFPTFTVAPLGRYTNIPRTSFQSLSIAGNLVDIDVSQGIPTIGNDFNFISCEPEAYEGSNIDAGRLLRIITDSKSQSGVIFYSTQSNHCNASADFNNLATINGGVFTTIDPLVAAQIANRNFTSSQNVLAVLGPDRSSYWSYGSSAPTTAVAMIILYSITGVITALFIVIIITGAIRAHRHPERYGPRAAGGRPRQSRAKGIARAMLETLPIVKFGDHDDLAKSKVVQNDDVELATNSTTKTTETTKAGEKTATTTTAAVGTTSDSASAKVDTPSESGKNADGSDDVGMLGCSICTEDFQKGEEVRVLPCNHKFHPVCVDPWLLNVSGTCPLCRMTLAPQIEGGENATEGTNDGMPPPLATPVSPSDRRSQAVHNLMAMAYGSRDERIAALRRYQTDRRSRNQSHVNDDERMSRARRFREAFRIRTRRHEENEQEAQMRNSGVAAISGGQMRF